MAFLLNKPGGSVNRKQRRGVRVVCAAAGACCAVSASAQSSVTVFGVVDTAARYVKNDDVGAIKSLVSGANATSRLGFRGVEDLGGGLSAGFHLEHGIQADSGSAVSASQFWDRRATVSLASRTLGELRAGRDFVPAYLSWSRHDPFGYVGAASSGSFISATPVGPIRAAYGSGGNTTVRSNNALQYILPPGLGGVEGGVMLAAGEGGSAANGQHKLIGGRIGFVQALFAVTVAHDRVENDLTTQDAHTDTVVGAQLFLSFMKLSLATRQFKHDDAKQTNLLAGAVIPVGSGELRVSYNRVNLQGTVGTTRIDANDASLVGLGYVHTLSKRTALYSTASRIGNQGGATFAVAGGASGLAGGRDSTALEVGLRHSF